MNEQTMYDHTPGPWKLEQSWKNGVYTSIGPVEWGHDGDIYCRDADALLIAAAPDLLRERDELRAKLERVEEIAKTDYPDCEMQLSDIIKECNDGN